MDQRPKCKIQTVKIPAAKLLQSCLTLCDSINGSQLGSTVPGVLQARTLEWVAISFSNAWKWKVKVKLLSRVQLLATPWTAAYQTPPSMGFSRQEYQIGVPLPSPYSILMHIYGIWKDGNDNPVCKTEKETQIYRTIFWTLWERDGGMIWENNIKTHIISYKKWITSPDSMQETESLGLVHWDDSEGWYGEGGGRAGSGLGTRVHPWQMHVDVWQNQYNILK